MMHGTLLLFDTVTYDDRNIGHSCWTGGIYSKRKLTNVTASDGFDSIVHQSISLKLVLFDEINLYLTRTIFYYCDTAVSCTKRGRSEESFYFFSLQ